MEKDLNKIRELAKKKWDENYDFRFFLKRKSGIPSKKIDFIVHKLYQNVLSKIDCKMCANCCKEGQPILDQDDIRKFSKGLGISVAKFKEQYLVKGEGPGEYAFNKRPCPFLRNNLCLYYHYRPKACVSYPYLTKDRFTSRLGKVIYNYSICPIVFNVYEDLKEENWKCHM